jgi:hypothetical protein
MKFSFSLNDLFRSLARPDPSRDWLIVLLLLTILFAGLVGYAAYLFIDIRWGDIAGEVNNAVQPKPAVTKAALDAVIQKYDARRSDFESHTFTMPKLPDPAQ